MRRAEVNWYVDHSMRRGNPLVDGATNHFNALMLGDPVSVEAVRQIAVLAIRSELDTGNKSPFADKATGIARCLFLGIDPANGNKIRSRKYLKRQSEQNGYDRFWHEVSSMFSTYTHVYEKIKEKQQERKKAAKKKKDFFPFGSSMIF